MDQAGPDVVSVRIGQRLKAERLRLRLTQTDMASLAGVSKTSQINYEQGTRSPDAAYLAALDAAGADVLLIVTGRPSKTAEPPQPDQVAVQWLDVGHDPAGAAGEAAKPYTPDALWVPRHWLAKRHLQMGSVRIARVTGPGMHGVLAEGALAFVDTAETKPRAGLVYAIALGGELIFRYCTPLPGGMVRIMGASSQVASYDVDPATARDVTVLGRVIAAVQDL